MRETPVIKEDPKSKAIAEILAIQAMLGAYGNNDSEMSLINKLLEDVQAGKIEPQEATDSAKALFDNKNLR